MATPDRWDQQWRTSTSARCEDAAASAVPEQLLEQTSLIAPSGHGKERIAADKEAGATLVNAVPGWGISLSAGITSLPSA
jgi:hypothetical protein